MISIISDGDVNGLRSLFAYFSYGNISVHPCMAFQVHIFFYTETSLDIHICQLLCLAKDIGNSLCRWYRISKFYLMLDLMFSQWRLLSELCNWTITAILCGLLDPVILWNMRHSSYAADKIASHSRKALSSKFFLPSCPDYNQFHCWLSVFHAADLLTYDLPAVHKP